MWGCVHNIDGDGKFMVTGDRKWIAVIDYLK